MALKKNLPEKARLHPRNKNRDRYDLDALKKVFPELKNHISLNKYGAESVDFKNPRAVKLLNQALLNHYYGIKHWDFPDENLCPPIPGRADYLHHIADLLATTHDGNIPTGKHITCLDIGVGASCIYPIIGATEYDWNFIGSDVEPKSITCAKTLVKANPTIKDKIECRLQENPKNIFKGIIDESEKIDVTICNPPFHSSAEEAIKGTRRKIKNLTGKETKSPKLNFAGVSKELIYEGGEYKFIKKMIEESTEFGENCLWFSTLVSKESNLEGINQLLNKTKATHIKTIPMGTGNKSSRIVVWTFLSKAKQLEWQEKKKNSSIKGH
ncbi:MAG: 23S rRNA (adenine1618-N6)-methyltransferase [Sphingobacteriales bacterium]|jgi:23S rRNA (adenine1618-N6)-methyltransferase